MIELPDIPGYKIKKKLGQGGMATVYLAVPQKRSRLVAIKLLNPLVFENPRFARRFNREARALKKLTHPNVVEIIDVGEINNWNFIVMEYFQDNLKERIKKNGRLQPEEALLIIQQIADALFYVHDKNIIHRDVKPDNIMFRRDNTPVILDFGIAKHLDANSQITRTGTSVGTPQYMSPEQCNAQKLDGRSDIYSLGVVLFEMLTGKPPYLASTTMGIIKKHLQEEVPQLPKRLAQFQPIIDKMMAKKRSARVKSPEQLTNLIKNLLNMNTGKITIPEPQKKATPSQKKTKKYAAYNTPQTVTQIKTPNTKPKTKAKQNATRTAVLMKPDKPKKKSPPKPKKKTAKRNGIIFLRLFQATSLALTGLIVFLLVKGYSWQEVLQISKAFITKTFGF